MNRTTSTPSGKPFGRNGTHEAALVVNASTFAAERVNHAETLSRCRRHLRDPAVRSDPGPWLGVPQYDGHPRQGAGARRNGKLGAPYRVFRRGILNRRAEGCSLDLPLA